MRSALRLLAAATVLSASAVIAHADNISVSMVGPFSPSGHGDSLQYNLQFTTFNAPTVLMQTGVLQTSTSATPVNFNFNFVDSITINGLDQNVTFTGTGLINAGGETITTNATGPIAYGNLLLNVPTSTFSGLGTIPVSLTGIITQAPPPSAVPEPSSIALLGTGVFALAGVARRKFRRA